MLFLSDMFLVTHYKLAPHQLILHAVLLYAYTHTHTHTGARRWSTGADHQQQRLLLPLHLVVQLLLLLHLLLLDFLLVLLQLATLAQLVLLFQVSTTAYTSYIILIHHTL
jgi:hypothetical protein